MTLNAGQIKFLMRRFVEDPWNEGDLDALDEVTADDYRLGADGTLDDLKGIIQELRLGFPDWTVTVGDVVAQDDKVAYRWTMHGTQQGEFEGIAPTGKSVTANGMTFLRLRDGMVVEDNFESSSPSATEQLALP